MVPAVELPVATDAGMLATTMKDAEVVMVPPTLRVMEPVEEAKVVSPE